ncbi:hypothetical protein B0H19DRAFT_1026509, partial [Mycena capillaripes]
MQLGQFSAQISVGDEDLTEYGVELSTDGMEAICWIASETGKVVDFPLDTDASRNRAIIARVEVDGIKCQGRSLGARGSRITTAKHGYVSTSSNTRRSLAFSKQLLTDDDAYLNAAVSPDLGTIKVLFNLVALCEKPGKAQFVPREPKILHERSKKAIDHCVQFGPEFHTENNTIQNWRFIKTLATFRFKYRPIGIISVIFLFPIFTLNPELLRAEGIAPLAPQERAVTPTEVVDLSMDVKEENADKAEIKRLQARLDALQKKNKNKQTHVKRE